MYRLPAAVICLLFIASLSMTAQMDGSDYRIISGTVLDDSSGNALPFVHVWNESSRRGTTSNDYGEFHIKVKGQDTLVFTMVGYSSKVIYVSPSAMLELRVRLKPKKYLIGEVVVRRFRSYESFKYQVVHLDLPESDIAPLKENLRLTSTMAALDAEWERVAKDKAEGFGVSSSLGPGIDREKAFKKKINALEKRKRVIDTKFNRALVEDLTQLKGEELTEFIAMCNFSDEYLYLTDLQTIIEALNIKYTDYLGMRDTIPSASEQHD